MAKLYSQKTFKMEIEFTVTMDELGEEHWETGTKELQQALIQDETALIQQMLAAGLGELQEYADYLNAQELLTSLKKLASKLDPEGASFALPEADFADLTRPIRVDSMGVQLNSSTICEKAEGIEGETTWEPVWTDLRRGTEVGKEWERFSIPTTPAPNRSNQETSHYLLVRYLTRQKDGVHIEGRCTCHTLITGVGEDELQAMDALWSSYQKHIVKIRVARQLQLGLGRAFWKR